MIVTSAKDQLALLGLAIIAFGISNASIAEDTAGKQVFNRWCTACHTDSPFAPGTIQLKQMRGVEKAVIEKRDDLTPELIRALVRQGLAGMPKFRRTEISDDELESLVRYLAGDQNS